LKRLGLTLVALIVIVTSLAGVAGCASHEKVNMPVVLLTDFGSEDYRVAQLQGIIYKNNPDARLIVASNDVPAFDIFTGAFILDIAAKEFPENTVFVAVIAPYAQNETKYLVLTTDKNQFFVLPDNGLLTYVARDTGIKSIYQVTNQELFSTPIKQLSAERIQGAISALIASGYDPQDVGKPLSNPTTLGAQNSTVAGNNLSGTVVYIDHYGNCITDISGSTASLSGIKPGDDIQVITPHGTIPARYGTIYSDVPLGKEIIFVNNNIDLLQLSVNMGSFAKTHNISTGTKIEIAR
jgi:S-adenosylmethionine hydrolase